MCGILGFIGRSVNQETSFELANALFQKTESRGEHASGFWGCETGDGPIYYDKEPVKSSIYVTRSIWSHEFANANADLLLAHCRYSSANVGHEKVNRNNHPHVTSDHRLALVHNGKVPEYTALRTRYDLASDCDSEILLRMFESQQDKKNDEEVLKKELPPLPSEFAYRLLGVKEIFARVNYGAMAVAIGERCDDGARYLWLFRDRERPLHVVDLRKTLGQIVFFSMPEIWRGAVDLCPAIKEHLQDNQRIIEFPEDQVWMVKLLDGNWTVKKFKITKTKFYDWNRDDDDIKFKRGSVPPPVKVISRLSSSEEIIEYKVREVVSHSDDSVKKKTLPPIPSTTVSTTAESNKGAGELYDTFPEIDMAAFNKVIGEIKTTVSEIETSMENMANEQSILAKDFEGILESLNDVQAELMASLAVLRP